MVEAGATYIQVDEPIFVTDEGADLLEAAKCVYAYFTEEVPHAKIIFQTYFEALIDAKELSELPVTAFGLDFVHGLMKTLRLLKLAILKIKKCLQGLLMDVTSGQLILKKHQKC